MVQNTAMRFKFTIWQQVYQEALILGADKQGNITGLGKFVRFRGSGHMFSPNCTLNT